MGRGAETRAAILDEALMLASRVGLEALSIGVLAKRTGMSKSGLFAHFASKEGLQRDVLAEAAQRYTEVVLRPALKEPRGLPRVERLFERWLHWGTETFSGGCPFVAAATEFDDREGPVRAAVRGHLRDLLGAIARAVSIAVEEGHLAADTDPEQVAYELWAILLAFHHYERLLGDGAARARAEAAFAALIDRHRPSATA